MSGAVTTLYPTGVDVPSPSSLALAPSGTLVVVGSSADAAIRVLNLRTMAVTFLVANTAQGSLDGLCAAASTGGGASGLAVFGSTVYVADAVNHRVRKISATGTGGRFF